MDRPGFIEADTVAHRGNALEGDFAYSVTYTDICSTWTENRAFYAVGQMAQMLLVAAQYTLLPATVSPLIRE